MGLRPLDCALPAGLPIIGWSFRRARLSRDRSSPSPIGAAAAQDASNHSRAASRARMRTRVRSPSSARRSSVVSVPAFRLIALWLRQLAQRGIVLVVALHHRLGIGRFHRLLEQTDLASHAGDGLVERLDVVHGLPDQLLVSRGTVEPPLAVPVLVAK